MVTKEGKIVRDTELRPFDPRKSYSQTQVSRYSRLREGTLTCSEWSEIRPKG